MSPNRIGAFPVEIGGIDLGFTVQKAVLDTNIEIAGCFEQIGVAKRAAGLPTMWGHGTL